MVAAIPGRAEIWGPARGGPTAGEAGRPAESPSGKKKCQNTKLGELWFGEEI